MEAPLTGLGDFDEQLHNRGRGRVGEDAAVRWLISQGYRIVRRNVVNHGGEIDVVARDGDTLCFIEIKTRRSTDYGPAIAAVGYAKQRKISRAAALYLAVENCPDPCRFDVLGLDARDDGWRFTLIRDAFPYNPGPAPRFR
jgi:putative endonuclease